MSTRPTAIARRPSTSGRKPFPAAGLCPRPCSSTCQVSVAAISSCRAAMGQPPHAFDGCTSLRLRSAEAEFTVRIGASPAVPLMPRERQRGRSDHHVSTRIPVEGQPGRLGQQLLVADRPRVATTFAVPHRDEVEPVRRVHSPPVVGYPLQQRGVYLTLTVGDAYGCTGIPSYTT